VILKLAEIVQPIDYVYRLGQLVKLAQYPEACCNFWWSQ